MENPKLRVKRESNAGWWFDATYVGTGAAGEYNFYKGTVSANSAFSPYQMEIAANAPEPASWLLMIVSGIAAIFRKRCCSRVTAG